ncbi:autotransporter assembly complex protein TamA [Dokdonella fugitiva]|jgi:translocation and assembly module TamA|uniref:Translocation and assembly module subunit TamA n=1 Tax=Dokdonella fugitiva TaxID=328517 RepID=A0A4R2ICT6_9GAMM|nr:autotransporter assembly complex family protein [Dokdonella fugitiva]TCO42087.1 translocation and assembly module TamA [Dokdonella fugitiva]
MRLRLRPHRLATPTCLALLLGAGVAHAGRVSVELDGVDGLLRDAALGGLELQQYTSRDVTAAQARRLYEHAAAQVRKALEPYGYYSVTVDGELRENGDAYVAVLHVTPGEPVKVATVDVQIDGDADGQRPVRQALAAFAPAKGASLDHAAYEKSKATIQAALFASGYLDAELVTHQVEVTQSANSADIHLAWKVGPRYRLGTTTFEGAQFPDEFLERYIPWAKGDFYTQDQVLALQQRLIDADYFAVVQVEPDVEHAADGTVPIKVMLAPAKRTIYTGGVFIGTDTGPGVRGGIERRWINSRGHKFKVETIVATRLKTASAQYRIPLAGPDNHSLAFGATFRDEDTDTSTARTFGLAATDSRQWRGWTRTLGLKFLTGDFKVANIEGDTTLLYPEASLARKKADDPAFVRDGWSLTFAARAGQKGLVSDTSFLQASADAKWIHGLGEHGRFIARGSLGATHVGDFDKLPPELRFFAGGDRSIRGYSFQTIGPPLPDDLRGQATAYCAAHPKSDCQDFIIGGKNLAVASAEYEYYFKPNWGIATFIDTGDAFSSFASYRQKIGVGVGARWRSPVGMVRVDLGVPVRDDQNHGVELHIVIGPDL